MNWRDLRDGQWILHVSAWSVLLGIFLFQSASIVGHAVAENKIGPVDANQTTDNYLQALTGLRHGSQRLSDVVQSLPKDRTLVIFVRADKQPSDFLGFPLSESTQRT